MRTPLKPHAFVAARAADKLSRSSQRLSLMAKLKFCTLRLACDFAVIYNRLARKATYYPGTYAISGSGVATPVVLRGFSRGKSKSPLNSLCFFWENQRRPARQGKNLAVYRKRNYFYSSEGSDTSDTFSSSSSSS